MCIKSVFSKSVKLAVTGFVVTALSACGGGSSNTTTTTPTPTISSLGPDAVELGISTIPTSAPQAFRNNFVKYTSITAPNGMPIHFYAQNLVSNEQMARARNILNFYLENVPLSVYGTNKVLVANQMAINNATLVMLNGSDNNTTMPPSGVTGQSLFQNENPIEGSAAYLSGDPQFRDAAFEEILHLMHDTGIGVDGTNNTSPGVTSLAPYQTALRAATENAITMGVNGVSTGAAQLGIWGGSDITFLNELSEENSLTQEYLAQIIDTYYGLSAALSGQNLEYTPQTRDQIRTMDPMGWALVGEANPRQYFNEFVTYLARIDSTFNGTFTLTYDANQIYTNRSQYLLNARLTGVNNSNLTGNQQDNTLGGNAGNNILDGLAGNDTALFRGNFSQYTITQNGTEITVVDSMLNRDGTTTLRNIETLRFADRSATPNGNGVTAEMDPFLNLLDLPISAQALVNNTASGGNITFQLNFRGTIPLPDGTTRTWTTTEQAPYIAGATRWLEVLSRAGSLTQYMLEMNISVNESANTGGNGVASPSLDNMYVSGGNIFPSQGMFAVNQCLYVEVTSTTCPNVLTGSTRIAEFNANIHHEMGHIFGIGSLWNLDTTANATRYLPVDPGSGSFRNYVSNSTAHQGLIYRQAAGVAAYNSATGSSFDFAPVNSGHLYSNEQNTPSGSTRSFNGMVLPSLETELMANGTLFTPVLIGFIQDLGWVIGSNPRPNQP